MILNKNKYVGRALDNRMGGFMIAELQDYSKSQKRNYPLVYTS